MSTDEPPTCGKGLAENSAFPARLAEVAAAMAKNLEVHMQALDQTDQNSRHEYEVYESLVSELQQAASQLRVAANQMAEARDLPMGRHDEKAMTQPRVLEAFENLVAHKQQLSALLEQTASRDAQLLAMMRSHIQSM